MNPPSPLHTCSYSDLCTPVGELTRLVAEYSTPWEQKSKVLQTLRQDYESMQRQLGIALKKIEMMAAEVCVWLCVHVCSACVHVCVCACVCVHVHVHVHVRM